MGARGPVPKRSAQRRRTNDPKTPITKARAAKKVPVPAADRKWHPAARRWYAALARSGQSEFYEPSDWATAWLIAESISRDLQPQVVGVTEAGDVILECIPMKGASLSAYLKAMSALLVTEGDRRRASLELERDHGAEKPAVDDVPSLDDWRKRLTS